MSASHAAHGVLFSAGLCLLVATNVMSVHSQNLNCVRVAESKVALQVSIRMRRGFCTLVYTCGVV